MVVHLVVPDPHAHPNHHNNRADWIGRLIVDLRPDVLINMGDMFDFPSLSGYDKGKASFHGRRYKDDVNAGLDFDTRMFAPIRQAKKRRPFSVFLEGNHEERIRRLLEVSPELEGAVSFDDLNLKTNYNKVIRYQGTTPGSITINGVTYCHYAVSGVMGRPISGEHTGYSLITKKHQSVTVGHLHMFDYSVRTAADGHKIHGLVCGVFQDYDSDWAGVINKLWARGVVIKREVNNGQYDLEWVSIERLKKEYSGG